MIKGKYDEMKITYISTSGISFIFSFFTEPSKLNNSS